MAVTADDVKKQIEVANEYRQESKMATGFYELEEKARKAKEAYDEAIQLFKKFISENITISNSNITKVELNFDEPNDKKPTEEDDTVAYELIIVDTKGNEWVYDLVEKFWYLKNCLLPLNEKHLVKIPISYLDVYEDEDMAEKDVKLRSELKDIIELAYTFYILYRS